MWMRPYSQSLTYLIVCISATFLTSVLFISIQRELTRWLTLATAVWNALSREGHFCRCAYFNVRDKKSSLFPFTHVFLTRSCKHRNLRGAY